MKRLQSILCMSLLTLSLSSAAFAGQISGAPSPAGQISGAPSPAGQISGKAGQISGAPGQISGAPVQISGLSSEIIDTFLGLLTAVIY